MIKYKFHKKRGNVFFLFVIAFLAFSCTTKNNDLKNQHLASDWSSYNWISYERQLNNCMRYQMDGHLETVAGTLFFIGGLPFSALSDVVICNEEIIGGYWSHVK